MAEALLRHRLADAGVEARVSSAGLLDDDRPASEHGVTILGSRGIPLDEHRSRRMTVEHLRQADLVLGMAREHVREAVLLVPEIWPRAFTLKELVRRAAKVGPRRHEPFGDWVAEVGEGRTRRELLGSSQDDDVADPYGMAKSAYEKTAGELDELIGRLVDLVWPPGLTGTGAAAAGGAS